MITEDYVSFKTAKLLKEKGFDEGCSFVVNAISKGVMPVSYSTTNSDIEDEKASLIALPTLQMAMKWLREVHGIDISIIPLRFYSYKEYLPRIENDTVSHDAISCKEYEEAAETAIKYCLENLI